MRDLVLNTLRYVFKNKLSMFGLFILLFIAVAAFTIFSNLSTSMMNSYNNLVNNCNLHNIVIYDKWSDVPSKAEADQKAFYSGLQDLGVSSRPFKSLSVTNGKNQSQYKVIQYSNSYQIDKLDVFDNGGLPVDADKQPTLPSSINFHQILAYAQQGLTGQATPAEITARQMLIYFASNASWGSTPQFGTEFKKAWNIFLNHPTMDPLNPDTNMAGLTPDDVNLLTKVQKYMKAWVDPNNTPTVPPMLRGARITFNMDVWNHGIPATGYFDDPSSYLAVVSPTFAQDNHKEVFPFDEYRKEIGNANDFPLHPSNIHQLSTSMPTTNDFVDGWLNTIPDKYKVYVNNIPYLIVGTGITPDFMYPIISFANVIPNPEKEALVYTNSSGYARSEFSFSTSPHEQFIVAKYDGTQALESIVAKINVLAEKYMAWPSNITAAYTYNDKANQMSPAALRVCFVVELVTAINGVSIGLTIFISILAIFVMALFAKRFVEQNRTTIAILISNGMNKMKVLLSIALIGLVPCLLAGAIAFIVGYFLQQPSFGMFNDYWMIPTPMQPFNVGWFFFATLVPMLIFVVLTFLIGLWLLRDNLVTMLKEDVSVKVGFFANVAKAIVGFAPIMVKFRSSLAFFSIVKMFFLIVMTTIASVVITFVVSTTGKLQEVNNNDTKNNSAAFAIDLYTPTIQGGQYKAVEMQQLGRLLRANHNPDGAPLTDQGYSHNFFYWNQYRDSPFFREYSSIHWPSASDSSDYQTNILYLNNKTEVQPLIDKKFGLGSMATIPWNVPKAMMPTDQINTSLQMTADYNTRLMTDMRPLNEAYFFNTNDPTKKGLIVPDANNSVPFPTTWAIQNFGVAPQDWALSYGLDPSSINYGVISAPEIPGFTSAEQVAKMSGNEIGQLIDQAYNTYGTQYNDTDFPDSNAGILKVKYYPWLFKPGAISNVRIDPNNPNVVLFDVNPEVNQQKYLLTTRSIFKQVFEKGVEITPTTDMQQVTFDPFTNTRSYGYMPNTANVTGIIAISFKINYVNFFLSKFMDPAYQHNFYRIVYNQILFNNQDDEPYTYIQANVNNKVGENDPITITGIIPDSKFIHLVNRKGDPINQDLFGGADRLIVNEYAAKKYDLKVGDTLTFTPSNTVWRYMSQNPEQIITDPSVPQQLYQPAKYEFKVVGINNTGHNAQFYTSMSTAQKVLGLATANNYATNSDISTAPSEANNYSVTVGMNNQWNDFGGFNGIFTSQTAPYVLTSNLSLYSPSGLYPGNDSWESTQLMLTLLKNTLKNKNQLPYLANALNMNVAQFTNACDTYKANYTKQNPTATPDQVQTALINTIMNGISELYGKMTLVSVNSSASALLQSAMMFSSLSSTFDQIEGIVSALVIVLSMIIVMLLSWLIVLDLLKLAAILKTLGYSDISNAWNFFCIFIPTWLVSFGLTIPFTILVLNFFTNFVFANVGVLVLAPMNWWAFILVELGIAVLFTIIFFIGMSFFKKINIVEVLKW